MYCISQGYSLNNSTLIKVRIGNCDTSSVGISSLPTVPIKCFREAVSLYPLRCSSRSFIYIVPQTCSIYLSVFIACLLRFYLSLQKQFSVLVYGSTRGLNSETLVIQARKSCTKPLCYLQHLFILFFFFFACFCSTGLHTLTSSLLSLLGSLFFTLHQRGWRRERQVSLIPPFMEFWCCPRYTQRVLGLKPRTSNTW